MLHRCSLTVRSGSLVVGVLLASTAALSAQPRARTGNVPPARFTDPDRVAKLTSSFGDVDRVFREYAEREHIPGAVWGIIIDGRLAHVGVMGYRDVASK